MGEPGLRPLSDMPILECFPNADFDHDGWVQTGELRQYADMTIPFLSSRFPNLVLRGNVVAGLARTERAMTQEFEGVSFPLIEIAQPTKRADAR